MNSISDLEKVPSRYIVTRDNLRLHYLDVGPSLSQASTTPILCLPGLTRNGRDFFPLAATLMDTRRVLILDARGRGRSDYATDPHHYRAEVDLDDIMQFLVAVGIERVVIVGTSFGGLMALALATFRPGVLAGLVLNDIGPSVGWQAVDTLLKAFSDEQPLSDWTEAASELKRIIPELGFKDDELWLHAAKATWHQGSDGRLRMDFDARLARVWRNRGVGEHDLWSLWDAARVIPTLSLRGQISGVLTAETVAKMKTTKPDLRTATVPSVGHAPSLIEPESHAALMALLSDVDALESQRERCIA
jgi:pimeloyl-ACP methyl ester carboxylesterase